MSVFDNPGNVRMGSAPYVVARNPRATDGQYVSGPVAFKWTGLAKLQDNIEKLVVGFDQRRVEGAQKLAADVLAYMKANAPWKDRSGQARATLMAQVVDHPESHETDVVLGYGVFYGVFLETKTYGGKSYAIIKPTITAFRDRVADYMK